MKLKYKEGTDSQKHKPEPLKYGHSEAEPHSTDAIRGGGRIRHTRFNSVCGIHKHIFEIFCS